MSRPGQTGNGLGALLVSLQLTDSAFPSGFYTLSHGLEGYAQAAAVTPETLTVLLCDLLRHGVGPADATALAVAHRAVHEHDWDRVVEADRRLQATKLVREQRVASARTGRQMLDVLRAARGGPALEHYGQLVSAKRSPGCQAVVAGVAYAAADVPAEQAAVGELFAFAASFVGAALRLRLTDHRRAQVTLSAVAPTIESSALEAVERDVGDIGGCVPIADVMSGRHERAEARMFAT